MSLNLFDAIIYINLKHRKDRKKEILQELTKLKVKKEKIHRIEGSYNALNGHAGCALSHIQAIEFAEKNKFKNVLILEDDCQFIGSKKEVDAYVESFLKLMKNDWDVFFLGTLVIVKEKTKYPSVKRIVASLHSHAYVINEHYYKTLKDLYIEAYEILKNIVFHTMVENNSLDRKWHFLQYRDRWFMKNKPIAIQRNSFSDISTKVKIRKYPALNKIGKYIDEFKSV
ncbi:MAG: hypothetical protein HZB76_00890 [Chlamydiae bacterium]|nr:hypothetical protein [Chlamydiota bacterium]